MKSVVNTSNTTQNTPKPTSSIQSICLDPTISHLIFLTYFYFTNNMAGVREVNKGKNNNNVGDKVLLFHFFIL